MERANNRVYGAIPVAMLQNVCSIFYYVSDMLRTFQEHNFIKSIPLIVKINGKKSRDATFWPWLGLKEICIKNSQTSNLNILKK